MILVGFAIVSLASYQLAKLFQKIKLPLITGFLITGIVAGPFALLFVKEGSIPKLTFINDISLAYIAFAAGTELYLKDLRGRFRSIALNSLGQVIVVFGLGAVGAYYLAPYIPFMSEMSSAGKLAVSMLVGTIFIASSPASAIAIINEVRAKGPFTQSALGVTVVKDVMVVILFSIVFSFSQTTFSEEGEGGMSILLLVDLILEIGLALAVGYGLGRLLGWVLSWNVPELIKTVIVLGLGYCIYLGSHFVAEWSHEHLPFSLHLEPLLICIIASFWVTNYSRSREVMHDVLESVGPSIYVVFFTLTGASMALDVLIEIWMIALILFVVRIVAMIIAGYLGGAISKDPKEFRKLNWMPFVTQAGVGLGLAVIIEETFPDWGKQFATVIIGVIVLNQAFGPPFFKWAISKLGEDHSRKATPEFDGIRDAILFGADYQSFALARQLKRHGWIVRIVTCIKETYDDLEKDEDLEIIYLPDLTAEALVKIDTFKAEAIVCLMDDEQNFKMCELAFENLGTKDLIVVLRDPANWKRFNELGVVVVEPSTAMVNLLDHMVRSPQATQLLLGMDESQDSLEVEVLDPTLPGILLRDLKLPKDVIILSVRRGDQVIIPHGYTRLRLHDYLSIVGSLESLDAVSLRLGP